jgi:ABC-type multidrug transport system ATPase subunit
MAPVVQLSSAVALLGRFPALAGVDLTLEQGEVVLLQGPNGAGKTTLLRVCAGLVPVVEGTAVVLGSDLVADPTTVRRRVGYLGHGSGLYPDLTIAENLRFWSKAAGIDLGPDDAALEVVIDRSDWRSADRPAWHGSPRVAQAGPPWPRTGRNLRGADELIRAAAAGP